MQFGLMLLLLREICSESNESIMSRVCVTKSKSSVLFGLITVTSRQGLLASTFHLMNLQYAALVQLLRAGWRSPHAASLYLQRFEISIIFTFSGISINVASMITRKCSQIGYGLTSDLRCAFGTIDVTWHGGRL